MRRVRRCICVGICQSWLRHNSTARRRPKCMRIMWRMRKSLPNRRLDVDSIKSVIPDLIETAEKIPLVIPGLTRNPMNRCYTEEIADQVEAAEKVPVDTSPRDKGTVPLSPHNTCRSSNMRYFIKSESGQNDHFHFSIHIFHCHELNQPLC